MNVNEYGNVLRVNVQEDISGRNNTLFLKSPSPVAKTKTIDSSTGLSVGTEDITTPEGTFLANEYVEYTIEDGDIFIAGTWEARLYSETITETERRITDQVSTFVVDS